MKEPSEIKANASWNQFLTSGKVEDYLKYVNKFSVPDGKTSLEVDRVGDSPHAGVYTSNRNYTETDTCR